MTNKPPTDEATIDTILGTLRAEPSAAFAAALRARLHQQSPSRRAPVRSWPLVRIAAGAAAMAATVLIFTVPVVRASAIQFLAIFRAVNFVPVPVDANRVADLTGGTIDLPRLIGEHVQVLEDSGPPIPVVSIDAASQSAGFDVRVPASLPEDVRMTGVEFGGPHAVRVVADVARANQALDALGISDLRAPDALQGKAVTIRVPSLVRITYALRNWTVALSQAPAPSVELPEGVDLALLGEIGLRVLGLPAVEAHRFAQGIDWNTTLVIPVPAVATSFKQVDIGGSRGILIQAPPAGEGPKRLTTAVLWSAGGRVYGMQGNMASRDILSMANSIR
jgi:hypothetical protein